MDTYQNSDGSSQVKHEMNNPLTILHGRLMILKSRLGSESLVQQEEIAQEIIAIERALDRLSLIVQKMN